MEEWPCLILLLVLAFLYLPLSNLLPFLCLPLSNLLPFLCLPLSNLLPFLCLFGGLLFSFCLKILTPQHRRPPPHRHHEHRPLQWRCNGCLMLNGVFFESSCPRCQLARRPDPYNSLNHLQPQPRVDGDGDVDAGDPNRSRDWRCNGCSRLNGVDFESSCPHCRLARRPDLPNSLNRSQPQPHVDVDDHDHDHDNDRDHHHNMRWRCNGCSRLNGVYFESSCPHCQLARTPNLPNSLNRSQPQPQPQPRVAVDVDDCDNDCDPHHHMQWRCNGCFRLNGVYFVSSCPYCQLARGSNPL